MNKLIIATGLVAVMAAASSCSEDQYDLYPAETGSVMMIKDSGTRNVVVYKTDDFTTLPVTVMKGGTAPENASKALLHTMDADDWDAYVELTMNKGIMRITPECYGFSLDCTEQGTECSFEGNGVRYAIRDLYMIPEKLVAWTEANADKIAEGYIPVIPMQLDVEGEGQIQADNKYLLITPDLQMAKVGFSAVGPQSNTFARSAIEKNIDGIAEGFRPGIKVTLPCKNNWGFSVDVFAGSNSKVTNYINENKISDWVMMPNRLWYIEGLNEPQSGIVCDGITPDEEGKSHLTSKNCKVTYTMPKDVTEMDLNIVIDTKQLRDAFLIDKNYDNMNTTYFIPLQLVGKLNFSESVEEKPEGLAPDFEALCFVVFSVQELLERLEIDGSSCESNDCEPSEGSVAALFDDNVDTFFHSTWSNGGSTCSAPFWSYIQIPLEEEFSSIFFNCATRKGGNNGCPKKIHLFGSNVDEPVNDSDWFEFATIADATKSLKSGGAYGTLGSQSQPFTSVDEQGKAKRFKHIRFCVETSQGGSLSGTGNFWFLSEIQVYAGQVMD